MISRLAVIPERAHYISQLHVQLDYLPTYLISCFLWGCIVHILLLACVLLCHNSKGRITQTLLYFQFERSYWTWCEAVLQDMMRGKVWTDILLLTTSLFSFCCMRCFASLNGKSTVLYRQRMFYLPVALLQFSHRDSLSFSVLCRCYEDRLSWDLYSIYSLQCAASGRHTEADSWHIFTQGWQYFYRLASTTTIPFFARWQNPLILVVHITKNT